MPALPAICPFGTMKGDWRPPGRQDAGAPSASLRDEENGLGRTESTSFHCRLSDRVAVYTTADSADVSGPSLVE